MPPGYDAHAPKRPVNLSLNEDLVRQARTFTGNLSEQVEKRLAEYVAVAADRCTPLPDTMPDEVAAAFPIAYGTSYIALAWLARLAPGETLLVTGAAGGVGHGRRHSGG